MLKNAQNEVFVVLVIGNINAELSTGYGLRADKVFKITDTLLDGVLNCTDKQIKFREFCRLNFSKSLITLIAKRCSQKLFFESFVKTAVSILNNKELKNSKPRNQLFEQRHLTKLLHKVEDLKVDIEDNQSLLNLVQLKQVLSKDERLCGDRVSNMNALMSDYKDLLRDVLKQEDNAVVKATNESLISQVFKQDADNNLTQFIDKKFLDECLA